MQPLEPTSTLLLDYLYDLLDEDVKRQVEEQLSTSDRWRCALEEAKQQQEIFAAACTAAFPDVHFQPAAKKSHVHIAAETAVRTQTVPVKRFVWQPLAIAAGILLIFFAGGTAGVFSWYQYYNAWSQKSSAYSQLELRRDAAQLANRNTEDNTQEHLRTMRDQIRKLEKKWKAESQRVENEAKSKQLRVYVTGPQTIQAGAKNQYRIETRVPGQRQAAPTDVEIRIIDPDVKDKNLQVIHREKIDNRVGRCDVVLPANLPVKPGKQLKLQVVARGKTGLEVTVDEKLPLVGRLYLTHLTTDRPMYRPGDIVRFRSLTLDRFSLKPPAEPFQLKYAIQGPNRNKVFQMRGTTHLSETQNNKTKLLKGPDGKAIRGIGAGEFLIPPDLPGGVYTIEVSEETNKFPAEKRTFLINKYQAPRLNKKVEFTRKSYGAGANVTINCQVTPVAGAKPIVNQPVIAKAYIDGQPNPFVVKRGMTEDEGKATITFTLPKTIKRGGSVTIQFTDGASTEPLVRTIPIVLNDLLVDFYPEGGDLIAGVSNRVYFEARTPTGKPAELNGRIIGPDGKDVVGIQTLNDDKEVGVNQGMGSFRFTPQAGKIYKLKIDSPIGIKRDYVLPHPQKDGVALNIPSAAFNSEIKMTLHNTGKARDLLVGAYCRGRLMAYEDVKAKLGQATPLSLKLTEPVGGVYRITVFEKRITPNGPPQLLPKAERLIWRRPVRKLNVKLATDKEVYAPGDRVKVKVLTDNEDDKSAPAIVLLKAVDQSIIKLADDKTARSMPVHYFLTTEIKTPNELEYADFLVSDHPKAADALDLLLGTQGWRRFVEADPQLVPKRQKQKRQQDVDRLLVLSGQRAQTKDLTQAAVAAVDKHYAPNWQLQQEKLADLEKIETVQRRQHDLEERKLESKINFARDDEVQAETELSNHGYRLLVILIGTLTAALFLVGVIGVFVGLLRTSREQKGGSLALLTGAFCLLLVFFIGGGGAVVFLGSYGVLRHYETEKMVAMKEAAAAPDMAQAMPGGDDMGGEMMKFKMEKKAEMKKDGFAPPQLAAPRPPAVVGRPKFAAKNMAPGRMRPPRGGGAEPGFAPNNPMAPMPDVNLPAMAGEMRPGFEPAMGQAPGFGGRGRIAIANQGVAREELERVDRHLRRIGQFNRLAMQRLQLRRPVHGLQPAKTPFLVREYAHENRPVGDGVRRDFTETVYWHPVLVLPDGYAEVEFSLSDSVTTFEVTAWAHTPGGRLGAAKTEVISRLPFTVEPKVPMEVNNNDKITIPVAISNDTNQERNVDVNVDAENLTAVGKGKQSFRIAADDKGRGLFTFQPKVTKGLAKLLVTGNLAGYGKDAVERSFTIVPEGFPQTGAISDVLEKQAVHTVTLPESWVKGSLQMKVQVFPSTLADLQKGLAAMLREPHGCFEQTSSSNYPNVMILSYLKESDQADPELEKKARRLLSKGYGRLTSYECKIPQKQDDKRGYEWFGGTAPPHEALTAYGLLQFKDMAQFHPVDKTMLERTEKYLLGQRDGKGGFKRNSRALDSFGRAPGHITDAYIVWALTEYGTKADLKTEFDSLRLKAKDSKDPYFLSLVALGLLNSGEDAEAAQLLKRVRDLQKKDGKLEGTQTSITSSRGRNLHIETTAVAVLGWLKANRPAEFTTCVRKAAEWIGKQRGGYGGFGSTQSTILALKALIAYTNENRKTAEEGMVVLTVNGQTGKFEFPAGHRGDIIVEANAEWLKPGKNDVKIEMKGGDNTFPYTLDWSYNTLKPANPDNCPVHLTAKLSQNTVKEGETVRLTATVENKSGKGQGMAVAVLGLPAGLAVPEDMKQLKEMTRLRDNGKKPGDIGAFEIRGRELVLYWRSMAPDQKIDVTIDLICRIPGEYRGPASRAYLYYQSDLRHWTQPLAVTITP